MNVVVLGLGYIGLPTAAMLADAGHQVVGVDVNEKVVGDIQAGCGHIAELEVRALAARALASGRLRVEASLPSCADAFIICVPTPTRNHRPDLHYVEQAVRDIAAVARDGNLIILESTVPPGTIENILVPALETGGRAADGFHIAHCPERVIPGAIVEELRNNARVIGGRKPIDAELAGALYASFCSGEICLTDCTTAELVKVVENTFRDVNLAFANELALLAEAFGINAWEVIALANKHPRVNVLKPGPGVGGHCIPVDPTFLSDANPFLTDLIQTARRVNERMPHVVVRLIEEMLPPSLSRGKIALLGAAYKADVDDTRESPTKAVVRLLREKHHAVAVYDPLIRQSVDDVSTKTLEDAVNGADALVLLVDHRIFRSLDPYLIAPLMRGRVAIDTRNFLNRDIWAAAGFNVRCLGVAGVAAACGTPQTA